MPGSFGAFTLPPSFFSSFAFFFLCSFTFLMILYFWWSVFRFVFDLLLFFGILPQPLLPALSGCRKSSGAARAVSTPSGRRCARGAGGGDERRPRLRFFGRRGSVEGDTRGASLSRAWRIQPRREAGSYQNPPASLAAVRTVLAGKQMMSLSLEALAPIATLAAARRLSSGASPSAAAPTQASQRNASFRASRQHLRHHLSVSRQRDVSARSSFGEGPPQDSAFLNSEVWNSCPRATWVCLQRPKQEMSLLSSIA